MTTATIPYAQADTTVHAVKPPRLMSLDAFRGATIVGMILVNNPGSWAKGMRYAPLDHAEWHGLTPTDWIFPFFLFIVGVAIPFSQSKRQGATESLIPGILRRSAILFGLGILLGLIPYSWTTGIFNIQNIRIPGVLQRIALCYLVAAILALYVGWRGMIVAGLVCLAIYTAIMFGVNVPNYGRGVLEKEGNAAGYIDGLVFGKHLYVKPSPAEEIAKFRALETEKGANDPAVIAERNKLRFTYFDPEGLVSTLPAIATVICGWFVGTWLRTTRSHGDKLAAIFSFGVFAMIVGAILDRVFMPINKSIWTPSYVFYTAGLACLGFGVSYWIIDALGYRRWATPLVACGMNAITIFFLAGAIGRLMNAKFIGSSDSKVGLKTWLYGNLFQPMFDSPLNESLAWALVFVAFFIAIAMVMHKLRIYIKV